MGWGNVATVVCGAESTSAWSNVAESVCNSQSSIFAQTVMVRPCPSRDRATQGRFGGPDCWSSIPGLLVSRPLKPSRKFV